MNSTEVILGEDKETIIEIQADEHDPSKFE